MNILIASAVANMSKGFGIPKESINDIIKIITELHSKPERFHHNIENHINDCIKEVREFNNMSDNTDILAALLWHDSEYNSQASDNEEKSAENFNEFGVQYGIPTERIKKIMSMIMATKNHGDVSDSDSKVVCDIDMAILGYSWSKFKEYDNNIRKEYSWVPLSIYLEKRIEILESFLANKNLFQNEYFKSKYDLEARRNLSLIITELKEQLYWNNKAKE